MLSAHPGIEGSCAGTARGGCIEERHTTIIDDTASIPAGPDGGMRYAAKRDETTGRSAGAPRGARAARSLFTRELLTVTHSRPNVGLNVCLQLAKVVAVVVDPLVDQIF